MPDTQLTGRERPPLSTRVSADSSAARISNHNNPAETAGSERPLLSTSMSSTSPSSSRPVNQRDRRRSSAASLNNPNYGVYRRPPVAMVSGLLVGIGFAFALHGFYNSINGTTVGDASAQERSLQIGTTLSFLAQISLVYSMRTAYVQWLWRELKRTAAPFRTVDAAFAATSDPTSFLHRQMITKIPVASAIAFVAWFVPVATFFSPATPGVAIQMRNQIKELQVPTPDISQAESFRQFAYTVNSTRAGRQKFLGARTIVERFAMASAADGEILPMPPPGVNATYEQVFCAPYVQCDRSTPEASLQTQAMIDQARKALDPSVEIISINYFAAVRASGGGTTPSSGAAAIANLTVDGAQQASNKLLVSIPQFPDTDATVYSPLVPRYITCSLMNASYHVQFKYINGLQNTRVLNRTIINSVPYPTAPATDAASRLDMSYTTPMWALGKLLQGTVTFQRDRNTSGSSGSGIPADSAGGVYSNINTDMARTVIPGASDLDGHFRANHLLSTNGSLYSPQRLQDMSYTLNRSFLELVPELSQNITLSLLVDPLLASPSSAEVIVENPVPVYTYQARNHLLAYGIACTVAPVANMLGLYAFFNGRVSYDTSFSSIACSTHAVHFPGNRLGAHERLGALPLHVGVAGMLLRFYDGKDGRFGFGSAEESQRNDMAQVRD